MELLYLAALEAPPTAFAVLTAREFLTKTECRKHLEQCRRAVLRRWPAAEWAVLAELQRRGALHLNLLIRGVPDSDLETFRTVAAGVWCSRVDAAPSGQFVGSIYSQGGLVRYLGAHFLKPEQAIPAGSGWRGHRFSCTRGFLPRPAAVMREEARAVMRERRYAWRAAQLLGVEDGAAAATEAYIRHQSEQDATTVWHAARRIGPGWYQPVTRPRPIPDDPAVARAPSETARPDGTGASRPGRTDGPPCPPDALPAPSGSVRWGGSNFATGPPAAVSEGFS